MYPIVPVHEYICNQGLVGTPYSHEGTLACGPLITPDQSTPSSEGFIRYHYKH